LGEGRERSGDGEAAAVSDGPQNEAGDALRRTRLANERTYLAWWRTGLTAFAVGLGAGKLVPELSSGTELAHDSSTNALIERYRGRRA